MDNKLDLKQLYFKETQFDSLMMRRIFNVLLVANPYDAFMMEDDGRIEEKIFVEYSMLSLRYPPRFTRAATRDEALAQLSATTFDLIICMPAAGDNEAFDIARDIKQLYPAIPMVVLTPFSHGVAQRMEGEDIAQFEYVFCWLGNTDLLVSIIKLIEDKMNLEHDVGNVGVQLILLVEDSIRFYSSVLPNLYKFVLEQSREFSTEALNEHQRTLRMRGRPKIVLARTYDEALSIYNSYPDRVLGVVTDVSFPHSPGEEPERLAGIKLCEVIRARDPFMPLIIQSSETENAAYAAKFDAAFIDKGSKKPGVDLRQAVSENFGFGDFVFRNPETNEEIARVRNLKELQDIIYALPAESFLHHIRRNHVSRWLSSRALFSIAEYLKPITWTSLQDIDAHRLIIFQAIVKYRRMKNQGVVAVFRRDRFDRYSNFARIGEGSLGGKGRGLAFIDNLLKHHPEFDAFEDSGAAVAIPKTVVLCTDLFDEFMESNNLYPVALSPDNDDASILRHFLEAPLPDAVMADLQALLDVVKAPIAVRSSSLLEDSHYQPFAGVYSTYMIPRSDDPRLDLQQLADAIRGVYASVYFSDSKAYMTATSNVIDQEKMAVILQEVVGNQYGSRYYPNLSGVARSINYYPIGDEQPEEGTVSLALGLGKYIVDGGQTLRFSPAHPHQVLQTSEVDLALKETQTRFYALDTEIHPDRPLAPDDAYNLLRLPVRQAEEDGSLTYIASTYDPYDQIIRDGLYPGGRKLITFANILQHDAFPLPQLISLSLQYGQSEMRRPVEIEFAAVFNRQRRRTGTFYLLQIRPIVANDQTVDVDIDTLPVENLLLRSANALGNGTTTDITDVVYVPTAHGFTSGQNPQRAREIERINRRLLDEHRNCILIGPGRWGSSDPYLGIPVKWPHISAAKLIVESSLPGYRVEPSQGTHFFQNLTSLGVAYFTIEPHRGEGIYRQDYLDSLPAAYESPLVRHVVLPQPVTIVVDGKHRRGAVVLHP